MPTLRWQKSSYSSGDPTSNCVEVATGANGAIHFRESDRPAEIASSTSATWTHFLTHIQRESTTP
jgi:hypothetical protein